MIVEMRSVAVRPTRRDLDTATKLVDSLAAMATLRGAKPTAAALIAYGAELRGIKPASEYEVIGAENYAWRLRHTLLMPWTPEELLARAEAELASVEARIAGLPPRQAPRPAAPQQIEAAPARVLALYDGLEVAMRASTVAGG